MVPRLITASVVVALVLAAGFPSGTGLAGSDRGAVTATTPTVLPTPQRIERVGPDAPLGTKARVLTGANTDPVARDLLVEVLREHGVRPIVSPARAGAGAGGGLPTVRLGTAERPDIAAALGETRVPEAAEGYALRVDAGGDVAHPGPGDSGDAARIALGGIDATGQYYAVQTFRQLFVEGRSRPAVAGVGISDHPSMPLRGTIEGFYGSPWTHAERMDQLAFYGEVKANTYVYAPKDDPYHRDR